MQPKDKGGIAVIQDMYKDFVNAASGLGDYQAISKTDLANGYCDADEANDEIKRSQYFAALMLRYWYKIYEWSKEKNLRMDVEDFVYWLSDALIGKYGAFTYRRWRDPKNKLYNDPDGPDKVINRALYSTRNRHYDYINKDKRRANYYTYSADESIELHGDSADVLQVVDDSGASRPYDYLIQSYIDQNKILEAVVLNNILYEQVFDDRTMKEKTGMIDQNRHPVVIERHSSEFDFKKLVKSIRYINDKYIENFLEKYDLTPTAEVGLLKVRALSSKCLNQKVKSAMASLSMDGELRSLIC